MNKVNYPKNILGRDFVCGDLHGCFPRLLSLLEFVNFDKSQDRLFSVGDLIDRGPENIECLRLLDEPWFHAVRGNHEQLMCDFYSDGPYAVYWPQNGGKWGINYVEDTSLIKEVKVLAQKAAKLPLMITVEKQNGEFFHVIHAELGVNEPITDVQLSNEEYFNKYAFKQTHDGDFILWGRWLFNALYSVNITAELIKKYKSVLDNVNMFNPNLSHIYSGHTPMRRPTRLLGQTNLDTKAYGSFPEAGDPNGLIPPPEWMGLTITEPLTNRFWLASYYETKEVEAVVL